MHLLSEPSSASRPFSCCRPRPNPAQPRGSPADDVPQRDHSLHVALLVHHIDSVDARPAQGAHHVAQRAVGGACDGRAHGWWALLMGEAAAGLLRNSRTVTFPAIRAGNGRRKRIGRTKQWKSSAEMGNGSAAAGASHATKDAGVAQSRQVLSKTRRLRENVSRACQSAHSILQLVPLC
jgi:hypothetical protein